VSAAAPTAPTRLTRRGLLSALSLAVAFHVTGCSTVSITNPFGSAKPAGDANPPADAAATAQQTAGTSAETLSLGDSKKIALATFEGDVTCTKLVAPFDTDDNWWP
jgi:hypothetical protein